MSNMLLYCYADILGYQNLLRAYSAEQLYSILNKAVQEMHKALQLLESMPDVQKEYKNGLYITNEFWNALDDPKQLIDLEKEYDNKSFHLKTYIAFDTLVVYEEENEFSRKHIELFSLAIDVLFLILYDKELRIRGIIGLSDDYKIDDEDPERLFLINTIDDSPTKSPFLIRRHLKMPFLEMF